MKFLVDMNLSPSWVSFLIEAGFAAVHWSEIGLDGDASDIELMQWASEREHIVLTADLDFGAILAATQRRHPSVIQIRADIPTPTVVGRAVLSAVRQARDELAQGAIVSVDAARARIRVLPFQAC
jgi:predicted nuclease of predicted toxin-antitoxin system